MSFDDDFARIVRQILKDHVYNISFDVENEPKDNLRWHRPYSQYCWTCPQIGHTIEIGGFEYEVVGVHHSLDNYVSCDDGDMNKQQVSIKVKCLNPDYSPYRW